MFSAQTKSICGKCKKVVNARVVERDGKIFLLKKCRHHLKTLIDNNANLYKYLIGAYDSDKFKPKLLLLAITKKCDMNCIRCYENSPLEKDELTIEKIENILKNFSGKYVLISGGEPTVREDLDKVIKLILSYGFIPILVTNGNRLVDLDYVLKLKEAGLELVTLAFDSFDDEKVYEIVENKKSLAIKLEALRNLKRADMKVTLSMTLIRNVNEKQIGKIIKFASKNSNFIKDVRIRSHVPWGRYIKVKKYCMSDTLSLLKRVEFKWEDIKRELDLRKYLEERFKIHSTLPLSCSVHFLVKVINGHVIPIGRFLDERFFLFSLVRAVGIKNLFKLIFYRFDIQKMIVCSDNLMYFSVKVWPDETDINLNEIKKCHMGYSNGGKILPFCLFHTLKNANMKKCFMGI